MFLKKILHTMIDDPVALCMHIRDNADKWARLPERPVIMRVIANDPRWAYNYADMVIKGRWPEGEPAIAKDPSCALNYAKYIIMGRWPEGEPAIAKDPRCAYLYAFDVIKDRWPEGEPAILKDPIYTMLYSKLIKRSKIVEDDAIVDTHDPFAPLIAAGFRETTSPIQTKRGTRRFEIDYTVPVRHHSKRTRIYIFHRIDPVENTALIRVASDSWMGTPWGKHTKKETGEYHRYDINAAVRKIAATFRHAGVSSEKLDYIFDLLDMWGYATGAWAGKRAGIMPICMNWVRDTTKEYGLRLNGIYIDSKGEVVLTNGHKRWKMSVDRFCKLLRKSKDFAAFLADKDITLPMKQGQ